MTIISVTVNEEELSADSCVSISQQQIPNIFLVKTPIHVQHVSLISGLYLFSNKIDRKSVV